MTEITSARGEATMGLLKGVFVFLLGLTFLIPFSEPASAADPATEALNQAATSWQQGRAVEAYRQAHQALTNIWDAVPFQIASAELVQSEPQGYGMFTPRQSNVFPIKNSEIWFYLEPIGYQVEKTPEGLFRFGISADIFLTDEKGEVKAGKENWLVKEVVSRRFNTEFFFQVRLTLSELPPGAITVVIRLNDIVSKRYAVSKFPLVFR